MLGVPESPSSGVFTSVVLPVGSSGVEGVDGGSPVPVVSAAAAEDIEIKATQ